MTTYAARRLVQAVPVLFMASLVVFSMIYLIPGDPAEIVGGITATPQQIAALRESMGLNRPLPIQYLIWLGNVVQGNLGTSFINQFPVFTLILQKLPATIQLAMGAATFALLVAFPLGIFSAIKQRTWLEHATSTFIALGLAMPAFWLGILLSYFVGLELGLLPPAGYASLVDSPGRALIYLVLPSITLGLHIAAILARFVKSAMLETIGQDFVRTARAKGLRERQVMVGHALKNALIPVVTVFGLQIGRLMSGAVVTEAIFDWPGVGKLILHSILSRDYTVVQGAILILVALFIVINLVVDLTYAYLDPRIRYS